MYSQENSDALLMSMHKHRLKQNEYRAVLHSVTPDRRSTPSPALKPIRKSPSPFQINGGRNMQNDRYTPDNPLKNHRNNQDTFPLYAKDRHKGNSPEPRSNIMEKLQRNPDLTRELQIQYGSNANEIAIDNYGKEIDPRNPRLIDKVLSNRTKENTRRQEEHMLRLRTLNEERERLIKDQEMLHEKRRKMQAGELNTGPDYLFLDTNYGSELPTWHSRSKHKVLPEVKTVHDTDDFINITNDHLPAQIAKYNRLKEQHEKRKSYLEKPYRGELGPQSYHKWQREHYNICRSIVEDVVEKFLDRHFRTYAPAMSQSQTIAHVKQIDKQLDKSKHAAIESRATQLIMEEIMLEVTSLMTKEIGQELRNSYAYVKNRTDMHLMKQAEAIAIDDENGRSENDAAYHLITKGFVARQRDRMKNRSDIWAHTQHIHMGAATDETKPEATKESDVELLQFHDIVPLDIRTYNALPTDDYIAKADKKNYLQYMNTVRIYWIKMAANITTIPLAQKAKGVTEAASSWDGRFLAVGTRHGDLLIYDLHTQPFRLTKVLCNVLKYDDPVDKISWSFDGRKILTTNVLGGTVKAWTWQPPSKSSVAISKEDTKQLNIKPDANSLLPEMMGNVLDLDIDRFDTKFQSGPFADLELHKSVYGPTTALFFPTFTLLGSQNNICITLENGDILRCDIENSYQENIIEEHTMGGNGGTVTVSKEVPKVYKSKIEPQDGPTTIGQGVPVELFREHNHPLVHVGFVENTRNMVSVDQKGYIFLWRYHQRHMSSYGYFETQKKYRLDMSQRMYTTMSNSKPIVVFSEKQQPDEKKPRTRQVINKQRKENETKLTDLKLKDPWHKQSQGDGRTMFIYAPKEVPDTGSIFHLVIRHDTSKLLSTYVTRAYKPKMLQSTKLIGCKPLPDGKKLVFMLLFPAYPPKDAHLTIVIVDLMTMSMVDWKRDIPIKSTEVYDRVLAEDIVSFDVSKVYGPTGSAYVATNFIGELFVYSLITGLRNVRTIDPATASKAYKGCTVGDALFKIAETSKVMFVGGRSQLYLVIYSNALKEKGVQNKNISHNQFYIIEFIDKNTDKARNIMWKKFISWPTHPEMPPSSLVVNPVPNSINPPQHPAAFMKEILMDLVDDIMESKYGHYTDEEMGVHEEMDQVRNYEEMKDQVEGRRTPYDPEDDYNQEQAPLN